MPISKSGLAAKQSQAEKKGGATICTWTEAMSYRADYAYSMQKTK